MNNSGEFPTVNPVIKPEDIVRARSVVRDVYMDEKIEEVHRGHRLCHAYP